MKNVKSLCRASCLLTGLGVLCLPNPAQARNFACDGGDVACLIAAISSANSNGKSNTISLGAGVYTLTSPGSDPETGLPPITGTLTIVGEDAENTIIERQAGAPVFRIFTVLGTLTLRHVTLRGGASMSEGGAIRSVGALTVTDSVIIGNQAIAGGGIASHGVLAVGGSVITNNQAREGGGLSVGGTATVERSTISDNSKGNDPIGVEGGGAIVRGGRLDISNSTIEGNHAFFGGGLNVQQGGALNVVDSTIARNSASRGGAIHEGIAPDAPLVVVAPGSVTITSTTIVENGASPIPFRGRAINNTKGTIGIKGSILASNKPDGNGDCPETATSLGLNLIGDASACPAFLQSTDITGDPLLGGFVDDGSPGHGYYPLLPGSPAVDRGGVAPTHGASGRSKTPKASIEADCSGTDQIGQPRVGRCDIGAIELLIDRVSIRQARFDDDVLFVSASSSAKSDDVDLFVSVQGCLAEMPMLRRGRTYMLLSQTACGDLNGATVTINSSAGARPALPFGEVHPAPVGLPSLRSTGTGSCDVADVPAYLFVVVARQRCARQGWSL